MRQRTRKTASTGQSRTNLTTTFGQSRTVSNPTIPRTSAGPYSRPYNRTTSTPTMPLKGQSSSGVSPRTLPQLMDSRNPVGRPPLVRRSFPTAGLNVQATRVVQNPNNNRPSTTSVSNNRVSVNVSRSNSITNMASGDNKSKCCCCCISTICSHGSNGVATASDAGKSNVSKDRSILNQSINSGTPNVRMLLKSVIDGTPEMKDLILNELELIFECKKCNNLFRSLINFLDHKRNYCKAHACESMTLFDPSILGMRQDSETITVIPTPVPTKPQVSRNQTMGQSSKTFGTLNSKVSNHVTKVAQGTSSQKTPPAKTIVVINPSMASAINKPSASVVSNSVIGSGGGNKVSDANKAKCVKSLDSCLEKLMKDKIDASSSASSSVVSITSSAGSVASTKNTVTLSFPNLASQTSASTSNSEQMITVPFVTLPFVSKPPSVLSAGLTASTSTCSASGQKKEIIMRPIASNPNAVFQTVALITRTPSSSSLTGTTPTSLASVSMSQLSTAIKHANESIMTNSNNQSSVASNRIASLAPTVSNSVTGKYRTYGRSPATATIVTAHGTSTHAISGRKDYSRTPTITTPGRVFGTKRRVSQEGARPVGRPPNSARRLSVDARRLSAERRRVAERRISAETRRPSTEMRPNSASAAQVSPERATVVRRFSDQPSSSQIGAEARGPAVKCPECDLVFLSRKTLNVHIRSIHTSSTSLRIMFPCPFCPLTFSQLCNGIRHLYVVHKKGKNSATVDKLREVMKRTARAAKLFAHRYDAFHKQSELASTKSGIWVNGSGVVGGSGHQIFIPDEEIVLDDVKDIYEQLMGDADNTYGDATSNMASDHDYFNVDDAAMDAEDEDGIIDFGEEENGRENEEDENNLEETPSKIPVNDHICSGCKMYFTRAAAKIGHEKTCSQIKGNKDALSSAGSNSSAPSYTSSSRGRKRIKLTRDAKSIVDNSILTGKESDTSLSEKDATLEDANKMVTSTIRDDDPIGAIDDDNDSLSSSIPSEVASESGDATNHPESDATNNQESDVTKNEASKTDANVELAKQLFDSNAKRTTGSIASFGIEMDAETLLKLDTITDVPNLKCSHCPTLSFPSETRLIHHSLKDHLGRQVLKCKGCTYTTIAEQDLDCHLEVKHGIKSVVQRSKLMINLTNPFARTGSESSSGSEHGSRKDSPARTVPTIAPAAHVPYTVNYSPVCVNLASPDGSPNKSSDGIKVKNEANDEVFEEPAKISTPPPIGVALHALAQKEKMIEQPAHPSIPKAIERPIEVVQTPKVIEAAQKQVEHAMRVITETAQKALRNTYTNDNAYKKAAVVTQTLESNEDPATYVQKKVAAKKAIIVSNYSENAQKRIVSSIDLPEIDTQQIAALKVEVPMEDSDKLSQVQKIPPKSVIFPVDPRLKKLFATMKVGERKIGSPPMSTGIRREILHKFQTGQPVPRAIQPLMPKLDAQPTVTPNSVRSSVIIPPPILTVHDEQSTSSGGPPPLVIPSPPILEPILSPVTVSTDEPELITGTSCSTSGSSPSVSSLASPTGIVTSSVSPMNTTTTSGHHLKIVLQRTSPPSPGDHHGHHHHHKKKKKSKKICYSVTTLDE